MVNNKVTLVPLLSATDTPTDQTPIAGTASMQVNSDLSLSITGPDGTAVTPFGVVGTVSTSVNVTTQNGEFTITNTGDALLNLVPDATYLMTLTASFANLNATSIGFSQVEVPYLLAAAPITSRVFLGSIDKAAGGWDNRAACSFFIRTPSSLTPTQNIKICLIDMSFDNSGATIPVVLTACRI